MNANPTPLLHIAPPTICAQMKKSGWTAWVNNMGDSKRSAPQKIETIVIIPCIGSPGDQVGAEANYNYGPTIPAL